MSGPQVCKHQVCDHSGGWFGMVFQEANRIGSREPPAAATATMVADLMLADLRPFHHALARQFDGISLR